MFWSLFAIFSPDGSMLNWFNIDDGFYYFQVAKNIAGGLGSTFDGINQTNGYHPLWMIICIPVFWFAHTNLMLPLRLIIIIAGLLNAGSSILLYKILMQRINKNIAFLAAVFWASFPLIQKITTTQGLETGLSIFLLLLLIYRSIELREEHRPINPTNMLVFGIIASLAILARLDNIFYVGMICIFTLFKANFRRSIVVYDWILISFSAFLSWIITLVYIRLEVNDYSVFPLLFLGIFIKTGILFLAKEYNEKQSHSPTNFLKSTGIILGVNLFFVGILYLINTFNGGIRFGKLQIILDFLLSTAFIFANHFIHHFFIDKKYTVNTIKSFFTKANISGSLKNACFLGGPIVFIIFSYLSLNHSIFSSAMPVSGKVKHYWSTLANTIYSRERSIYDVFGLGGSVNPIREFTGFLDNLSNKISTFFMVEGEINTFVIFMVLFFITVFLILLFFILAKCNVLNKFNGVLLTAVFIGSILRVGYFSITGYVGARNWYWIIEKLIQVILLAVFIDVLFELIGRKMKTHHLLVVVATVFSILLLFNNVRYAMTLTPWSSSKENPNAELEHIKYLENNTPEGSLIGMTGSGTFGYFIQGRTIVNLDGLINSVEYFQSLVDGNADEYLSNIGLDYVYSNPYIVLESDPYRQFLPDRLRPVDLIDNKNDTRLYDFINE